MFKVDLTESAKEQVNKICLENAKDCVYLSMTGGGCAGFEYEWSFVTEFYSNTYAYTRQFDGFALLVNDLSLPMLEGSVVDLKDEGVKGSSLIVTSPKAIASCGCGESVTFDV